MSYKPRPRQQEAIDKMVKFVNSKTTKKGIFVYPTSFGKSIVIANVASMFPDKYFINIVPKKELLEQNYEKYTSYGYKGSVCSASLGSNEISKVTFATIGTLKKHIDFFKDKDVVILHDECQNGSLKDSQLDLFFKGIKKCKLVGTTATPLRLKPSMGGTELKMMNRMRDCLYTSIEDVVQIQDMVEQGYWTDLLYEVEDIDETSLQLNTTGTDYTLQSLKKFSEENNIIEKCETVSSRLLSDGRNSTLIYVSLIEEAIKLENKIESCKALHSKLSKRERDFIIEDFKSGKLKFIANVGILIEGFDYPPLTSIIMARPTNSITIYYQSIGRLVRKYKGKLDAKVVDISGNFNKFGKVEDITFENNDYTSGWAAFSKDRLLTNYPLGSKLVPTKQSLKDSYERKKDTSIKVNDPLIYFGKYKGKKISDIYKKDKNYLAWIIKPETKFEFWGEKGRNLKAAIYNIMKLPAETDKVPF